MSAALQAADPDARIAALGAAHRLGLLHAEALQPFFADPDAAVRYRAVELAARFGDAAGRQRAALAERLVQALADDGLTEVAAFALGELQPDEPTRSKVVRALEEQVSANQDPLVRESAVAALGALGGGVATILEATEDIATVRRRAMLALAPFDGTEVEQALRRGLQDRDWQVRQAAEDLLGDEPG